MSGKTEIEKRISGDVNYEIFIQYLESLPDSKIKALRIELIKNAKVWKSIFNGLILTVTVSIFSFIFSSGFRITSYIAEYFDANTYNEFIMPTIVLTLTFLIFVFSIYLLAAYTIACKEKKILIIEDYLNNSLEGNNDE